MKLRRLTVIGVIAGALVTGPTLAGCLGGDGEDDYATTTVAEDCDVEDQRNQEDDCGYWQRGSEYRTGAQPDATWFWIWYTWVRVGQLSAPPAGWRAPYNLKFPMKTVRVSKQNCALSFSEFRIAPPPRPPAVRPPAVNPPPRPPAVRPPAGGGGNPAPAKPKAPVYKPPAGVKVKC